MRLKTKVNYVYGFWQKAGTYGAVYSRKHIFYPNKKQTICGIVPQPEYGHNVVFEIGTIDQDKVCKRCKYIAERDGAECG